jgi:hypothetical protein
LSVPNPFFLNPIQFLTWSQDNWQPLVDVAEQGDIIIVAEGINDDDESESNDRQDIGWSGGKIDLIGQLAALGKPVILAAFGDQLVSLPPTGKTVPGKISGHLRVECLAGSFIVCPELVFLFSGTVSDVSSG